MNYLGSLDSSRDLQSICVMRFIFRLHLVRHANDLKKIAFYVLGSKQGLGSKRRGGYPKYSKSVNMLI